jgi:hypothetical protein
MPRSCAFPSTGLQLESCQPSSTSPALRRRRLQAAHQEAESKKKSKKSFDTPMIFFPHIHRRSLRTANQTTPSSRSHKCDHVGSHHFLANCRHVVFANGGHRDDHGANLPQAADEGRRPRSGHGELHAQAAPRLGRQGRNQGLLSGGVFNEVERLHVSMRGSF